MELRRWRTNRKEPQTQWLPQLLTALATAYPDIAPAQRTLLRWDAQYKSSTDLLNLVDTRGGDQRSGVSPEAWAEFERQWLIQRGPSIASVHRRVAVLAKQERWTWCQLQTCRRMVADRIPPEKQAFHREPAKWRMVYEPKIAQHPERFAAGRCWLGDHTAMDFWVRAGNRIIRSSPRAMATGSRRPWKIITHTRLSSAAPGSRSSPAPRGTHGRHLPPTQAVRCGCSCKGRPRPDDGLPGHRQPVARGEPGMSWLMLFSHSV